VGQAFVVLSPYSNQSFTAGFDVLSVFSAGTLGRQFYLYGSLALCGHLKSSSLPRQTTRRAEDYAAIGDHKLVSPEAILLT
jgi:hypothetical protein